MTPQEKAKQLVEKYWNFVNDYSTVSKPTDIEVKIIYEEGQKMGRSVQCALIAVEEVITAMSKVWDKWDTPDNYETLEFWTEVKNELQKL